MTSAVVIALVATLLSDTPPRVPEIALDSMVLFHLERAIALFVGVLVVIVVIARGWRGELPTELSTQGLRYSEAAASAVDELAEDIEALRDDVSALAARVKRIEDAA